MQATVEQQEYFLTDLSELEKQNQNTFYCSRVSVEEYEKESVAYTQQELDRLMGLKELQVTPQSFISQASQYIRLLFTVLVLGLMATMIHQLSLAVHSKSSPIRDQMVTIQSDSSPLYNVTRLLHQFNQARLEIGFDGIYLNHTLEAVAQQLAHQTVHGRFCLGQTLDGKHRDEANNEPTPTKVFKAIVKPEYIAQPEDVSPQEVWMNPLYTSTGLAHSCFKGNCALVQIFSGR